MINKTDISKFSIAEATSNSNGKTSGSKVAGFIVVITSCICISACTVYSILGGASGDVIVYSTTPSTLPTTGALVVNGGIGADHVRANNFYGNGSNLTGVQTPITLTTNGTSGLAEFINGTINIPNYGNGDSFSPTTSNLVNCSSIGISNAMYSQVGNIKTFAFRIINQVVTSNIATFDIQLPIPSTTTSIVSASNIHNANVGSCYVNYKNSTSATIEVTYSSAGTYSDIDFIITYK